MIEYVDRSPECGNSRAKGRYVPHFLPRYGLSCHELPQQVDIEHGDERGEGVEYEGRDA